jgi:hypothetical protein
MTCFEENIYSLTLFPRYYIEILLQEYTLSAFVDVGLYQYKNVFTEQQTGDALNEEQVIKSQSTVVPEVQVCCDNRFTLLIISVQYSGLSLEYLANICEAPGSLPIL